jgi:hypothetical protein
MHHMDTRSDQSDVRLSASKDVIEKRQLRSDGTMGGGRANLGARRV